MNSESMEIVIDENGQTKITVSGCPGPACKELSKGIERAIGDTVADEPTQEAFQKANAGTVVRA